MRDIIDVVFLIKTLLPSVANALKEDVLCGICHGVVRYENKNFV